VLQQNRRTGVIQAGLSELPLSTRLGHSNWHAAMAGLFQIQPFEIDVLG